MTSQNCIRFFVTLYINCLRLLKDIHQPFSIQRAMISNLNLIVFSTFSLCKFSQYLKLSHNPISLQLVFCFFLYAILKEVISFSFFCNTLILTLASVQYKRFKKNNVTNVFAGTIAIINPIAVVQFFETIYTGIFEYLFTGGFKNDGLLELILMYFGTIKRNSQNMLYFYPLVWLCIAFYLLEICN